MKEQGIRLLAACVFLWMAAIPDFKTRRIPVWIPAVFLAAAAAADLFPPAVMFAGRLLPSVSAAEQCLSSMLDRRDLLAGAVPGAVLLLISLLTRGKIGEGDGICLLVCGLFVGITQTILITKTALLLAAAVSAVLLFTRRLRAQEQIPFVPFLAAAATILLFFSV